MHIVSSAQLIEPTYTAFVSLTQVKNASVCQNIDLSDHVYSGICTFN